MRKAGAPVVATLAVVVVTALAVRSQSDGPASEPAAAPMSPPVPRVEPPPARRLSQVVDGVRFSFEWPFGWLRGPITRPLTLSGSRNAHHFVSKSPPEGPQGAEAVLFWTTFPVGAFPDGENTDPCAGLVHGPVGPSPSHLVSAMGRVPGVVPLDGPVKVRVGGRRAVHAAFRVLLDIGCDPGFFFTWRPRGPDGECWGACWLESSEGDTIRVWVVEVGGTRLVVQAETRETADADVDVEILAMVRSLRFDS